MPIAESERRFGRTGTENTGLDMGAFPGKLATGVAYRYAVVCFEKERKKNRKKGQKHRKCRY